MIDVRTQTSLELTDSRCREVVLFAGHAVRCDADKIGWLPWQFYEHHAAHGTLVSVTRDGDLVGFVVHTPPSVWGEVKILQTWVRKDARMIEHGRALIGRVTRNTSPTCITCWVGEDLDAMRFWPAIGFTRSGRRLGRGDLFMHKKRRLLAQFCLRIPLEKPCLKLTIDRHPSSCDNTAKSVIFAHSW